LSWLARTLEGVASIPHPEGHAGELKQAEWYGDCCLGDVLGVHGDLVVLYPFFRSILEKILLLATLVVKSIMFGMG